MEKSSFETFLWIWYAFTCTNYLWIAMFLLKGTLGLTYRAKFLNNAPAGPWWNERDDWNALGNITI
jgi:hypothetical protein